MNTPRSQAELQGDRGPAGRPLTLRAGVVWGIWGALMICGLLLVHTYGSNVPSWDDWDLVPTMTGHQPVTLRWLWSQHNEHRIPVPRLIDLALLCSTHDFRACMYFNVAVMGLMSAALIMTAGRLRGDASYCDALFPLLLLNPAQALNFIWGWQVEFFASTLWAGTALLLIVTNPTLRARALLGMLVVILLLVGSGAHGLALVPALALWGAAALLGPGAGRPAGGRGNLAIAALVCAASALLVGLYFAGYQKVPHHPHRPGIRTMAQTVAKAVTMAYGPAVRQVWPWSGVALCGLLAATGVWLLVVLRREPRERVRAWGLLCYLGAVGSLALALGLGRDGFEPRYVTLMCPLFCGVYFVWCLHGPGEWRKIVPGLMLLAAILALWANTRFGIDYAIDLRHRLGAFESDIASGVPPYMLISRYHDYLHPSETLLTDYLPMLRDGGVGKFSHLVQAPPLEEFDIPSRLLDATGGTWNGRQLSHGGSGAIELHLSKPLRIAGLRLGYKWSNDAHRQPLVIVSWRDGNHPFDTEHRCRCFPTGDRANWEHGSFLQIDKTSCELLVWIGENVSSLRIVPDYNPGTFSVEHLVLLVPQGQTPAGPVIAP